MTTFHYVIALVALVLLCHPSLCDGALTSRKWAFDGAGATYCFPTLSPNGSALFITTDNGTVSSVSADDGSTMWRYTTAKWITSAPALSPDGGVVLVACVDYKVYALRASSGELLWTYVAGSTLNRSPSVSRDGASVYIGSNDQCVHSMRLADGRAQWRFKTEQRVRSTPAQSVDEGVLYVGSDDHKLYALNESTGELLWSYTTGDLVASTPAFSPDGSAVYVTSFDKHLHAVGTKDGQALWRFATDGVIETSPVVRPGDGVVYVGSADRRVYALNGSDGRALWNFTSSGAMGTPSLSPDGNTLYASSSDRNMYVLDASDGKLVDTYETGGDAYVRAPVSPDGTRVFVGAGSTVLALSGAHINGPAAPPTPPTTGSGASQLTSPSADATPAGEGPSSAQRQQGKGTSSRAGGLGLYYSIAGAIVGVLFVVVSAVVAVWHFRRRRAASTTSGAKGSSSGAKGRRRYVGTAATKQKQGVGATEGGMGGALNDTSTRTDTWAIRVPPHAAHAVYNFSSISNLRDYTTSLESGGATRQASLGRPGIQLTPLYYLSEYDPGMTSSGKAMVRDGHSILPSSPPYKFKISSDLAVVAREYDCLLKVLAKGDAKRHVVEALDYIEVAEPPPSVIDAPLRPGQPLAAIVLERGEGNLRKLILDRSVWMAWTRHDSKSVKVPKVRVVISQVAEAIQAIHNAGFIWRDLKPENLVLFRQPWTYDSVWKAIDLDTAVEIGSPLDDCCTPPYAPPELAKARVLGDGPHTLVAHPSFDAWGLGVLLLELLQGEHYLAAEIAQVRVQGLMDWSPVWDRLACPDLGACLHEHIDRCYASSLPDEARLLKQLLHTDPTSRLPVREFLRRSTFSGSISTLVRDHMNATSIGVAEAGCCTASFLTQQPSADVDGSEGGSSGGSLGAGETGEGGRRGRERVRSQSERVWEEDNGDGVAALRKGSSVPMVVNNGGSRGGARGV